MDHFIYKNNSLHCEDLAVEEIAAEVGTPFYLYSAATLSAHFKAFDQAFTLPHITCFAVKSCSNIAILNHFANMGGGADIVSGGELYRALRAGVDPEKIVYSGVGKREDELRFALESGILMFNVESVEELGALQKVAADMGVKAPVSLRINPDVDPKTHAYISTGLAKNKFGIPVDEAVAVYQDAAAMANIEIRGVSCHIGSQLTQISPFVESLTKVKLFIGRLAEVGIEISYLDLGGGVGIRYNEEEPPLLSAYAQAIMDEMAGLDCTLILEPGRVIVGNAGILVTRVLYTKEGGKKFVVVDAGMNDLARPSLYDAYHAIEPVEKSSRQEVEVDVGGPICETGDFLARGRQIAACNSGELLAVRSAGAYGFTMSSNYNSRPRVAEVLVDGSDFHLIRQRETYQDLIAGENIPGEK